MNSTQRSTLAGLSWTDLVTLSLALTLQAQDAARKLDAAPSIAFESEAKRTEYVNSWADGLSSARKLLDRVGRAQNRFL